jgi:hypothetical protein
MFKNPVQATFSILFLGSALVFTIFAVDKIIAEQQQKDKAAQAAGFANSDEKQAANSNGFTDAVLWRVEGQKREAAARAERDRLEAAAAKAKAEEDSRKKTREARFQEGLIYARVLKKSMKNPDSFKLEQVIRTVDGIYCFEYRATNSFNTIFNSASFGQGTVVTGWGFELSDPTRPTYQRCYYEQVLDKGISATQTIAMDGLPRPPSRLAKVSFDFDGAVANCIWFSGT